MLAAALQFFGGPAYSRRDLRLLYTAILLSFLGTSMTFPLRMLYAQAHHATPNELGIMAAAFLIGPIVFQLPSGWLVDQWGRVPVLLTGLIMHAVIAFLYIPFNSPVELIILRLSEGVAVTALRPAMIAYITDVTPEEHRSESFGALSATINVGMLIGPLFGGIIGQQFGFATAFFLNFVIEVLAIPLVVGWVHEPAEHQAMKKRQQRVPWKDLFSLPLVGAYTGMLTVQVVFSVLGALWAIWVSDLGGSYTFIGFTFSVFALPQIFLATGAGRMADRWGKARFVLVSGIIASVIYVSYGFIENLVVITILGVLEGVVLVFLMPVAQSFMADASPEQARGRVQGVSGLLSAVAGAGASYLSLPLYHQSREIPFAGAGAVMLIGSSITAASLVMFYRSRVHEEIGEPTVEHSLPEPAQPVSTTAP